MESIHLDPIVSWILRLALAALFATAAAHKLRDFLGFRETLAEYEILPRTMLLPASIGLVVSEGLIAIDLATGWITNAFVGATIGALASAGAEGSVNSGVPWAGLAAALLLALYGAAIGINLLRGRSEIDCGCLGPAVHQPLSSWLLVRNAILATGALLASLPLSNRDLQAVDGITLIGGFILLSLLFNSANGLAADRSRWLSSESLS